MEAKTKLEDACRHCFEGLKPLLSAISSLRIGERKIACTWLSVDDKDICERL